MAKDPLNPNRQSNTIQYYQNIIAHYALEPSYCRAVEFVDVIPFRNRWGFKTKDATGLRY